MKRTKTCHDRIFIKTVDDTKNSFKLTGSFSAGEILAMKNALSVHAEVSSVAQDVLSFLLVAINNNTEVLNRLSRE